jgi:hypothetical protein
MAASANSIKKVMDLTQEPDGTINMNIHLQMRPDKHGYVDTRPCGNFGTNPVTTAQGMAETVAATVTEFMKAVEKA